jgi:hypothetical protein
MQGVAVVVIVALAAIYAVWRLAPRALRAQVGQSLAHWGRRHGRLSETEAAALARRLSAGGCGSCDNCGSCGTAKPTTDASLRYVDPATLHSERR